MPRGNRTARRYSGGAPRTYWRGSIGREARAALAEMAAILAFEARMAQEDAEAALVAQLILQEYERPRPERPAIEVALALLVGAGAETDDTPIIV